MPLPRPAELDLSPVPHRGGRSRRWWLVLSLLVAVGCRPALTPELASTTLGPLAAARQRLLADALAGLDLTADRVRVVSPRAPERLLADDLAAAADLLHRGRSHEAIAVAARAVRSHPREPAAYASLAAALQLRGRLRECAVVLRTGLDLAPGDRELVHRLAIVLQARQRRGEAITLLQDALARDPEDGFAHARLAVLLALVGEHEEARRHATLARRLATPAPPQLEMLLAPTAAQQGSATVEAAAAAAAVRVDSGGTSQAAEPTVIADGSGQRLVAGWNDLRQAARVGSWRLAAATSADGGASWHDTIVRAPAGQADDYEGDPMVAHDARTGEQWVGGVLFGYVWGRPGQLYVARRDPAGNGFLPAVAIATGGIIDKPLLAAGPRPGLPVTTRLYVAYNLGLHRSDDLGASWSPVLPLGQGIGQQPRVGPAGELHILYWDGSLEYRLLTSLDGGTSFGPPRTVATRLDLWGTQETSHVPGNFRVPPLGSLAVDPLDGALYVVYADSSGSAGGQENVDVYFTRSTDGGQTWSIPRVVHGDSTPPRDQFHPWIEVGPDHRLHLVFLDTRRTPQLDGDANALLDVYYATSVDRGDSWVELAVTPQPFESRFAVWPGFSDQFVGDFIGATPVPGGVRVLYPSTVEGNLDIHTQLVAFPAPGSLFADDFESGALGRWDDLGP